MNVVFFITASEQGRGGHYYSLLKTANEISKHKRVTIVSIGAKSSPVLEQFHGKYKHIDYNNIWASLRAVLKFIKKEKAGVFHAFDSKSYFYAWIASILSRTPIVLTRCGGKNPKYYPYNDEIIVYSIENLESFKNNKRFKNSNLNLIPNRVDNEEQNHQKIEKIKKHLKSSALTILRVARISDTYKKSILQSIKLTQMLNERGVPAQLIIIGYIQKKETFNELIKHASDEILFFTESEYTINASSLIDVADFVVGTGRGFMEAALLGKVMLAPNANLNIPVLVHKDKVSDVFRLNFSPRYHELTPEEDVFTEILEACELYQTKGRQANLIEFAQENFSAENIYKKHLPIYNKAKPAKLNFTNILIFSLQLSRPRHKIKKIYSKIKKHAEYIFKLSTHKKI